MNNNFGTDEQKKKKLKIIILAGAAFLLIILAIIIGVVGTKVKDNNSRENILKLAQTYAERGEFERALNKLDSYLEKNSEDEDIWGLWNLIIDMKKAVENGEEISLPPNFKIDVDTSNFSDAIQQMLDESKRQAEENRTAMENLIKMQEEQKIEEEKRRAEDDKRRAEDDKRRADEDKRRAEEEKLRAEKEAAEAELKRQQDEERKAEEAAAAERRRIAEEKRKAEEAEIAKKNAELKKKIDETNDKIQSAKTALATGDYDTAVKLFEEAEKTAPDEAGKKFIASKESEIAQSLYDAAQSSDDEFKKKELMNQAVETAKKTLELNPDDPTSHYILAQDALDKKDFELALKEMNKAVQNDPQNYLYFYDFGKIQYRLKKYTEAAASFSSSCNINPKFAPSRYNLGLTQKMLKNETAALDAFRKTIDIDPRHEKAYLEQAKILSNRKDYSGAAESYKMVLKLNNINVQAAMELGSVYYQQKKYKDSEDCYKKAISLLSPGEDLVLTKYNLSAVLFDEGKNADAERYAREAYEGKNYIKNKNSIANIIYQYAMLLDYNKKTDDAIPVYMEVLENNPEHTKTKLNLGVMYLTLDPPDVDTALALFKQVYSVEKNNFEVNNNLGNAYLIKEDYAMAVKFYQNALKLEPKNNEVLSNLAKAYAKNQDYDSAKAVYTDLLKQDSKNWDGYIELAKVCMQLGDNSSAEKYLIVVQEKNPSYKSSEVSTLLAGL
ncbi:MAG: tetratricopeptide repeat protein [Treponema sp.]|nr:tetratricopeptide repeat protein [Treponema sp.]